MKSMALLFVCLLWLTISAHQVAIYGLGAAVGLLVLLLVATITGWIWTCCVMKRREKILITGRNNAILDRIDNPNYTMGDRISLNQNPQPEPEYDNIPPHLGQEHGYDILNRAVPNSIPNESNEQRNTTKFDSRDRNPLMCKPVQWVYSSGDRITPKQEDHTAKDRKEEVYSHNDKGLPSFMNVAMHANERKKVTTQGGNQEERDGIVKIAEIESDGTVSEHVYFQLENDKGLPSSMNVAMLDNERKKVTTQGGNQEERDGIVKIGEIESDGTGLENVYFQLENGDKEQEQMMTDSVQKSNVAYYEEFK